MSGSSERSAVRWHVRVRPRTPELDGHGRQVLADIRQAGLAHIEGVRSSRLYFFGGRLTESQIRLIAEDLLADPVAESYECGEGLSARRDADPAIEVHALPGVMNPVALSTLEAARHLLGASNLAGARIDEVQTARRYEIAGARNVAELERIAATVLANDCIERCYLQGFGRLDPIPDEFPTPPRRSFTLRHVSLRDLADEELIRLSRGAHLFLSLDEMRAIRDHFSSLGRDPTDLELETLAQTWSEHCAHKTLKSSITYRGEDFGRAGQVEVHFDNLLKETIAAATTKLDRPWCLSVFVDNAGVIAFDDAHGLAFKVETHNHPSAIEPYGGAATGVGGCIRDIMGCGLGAKPIASTDVFCLGPPDFDAGRLPAGMLHPRRVLKGVVGGVRDYGNRMGIPTVNGAIHFDAHYLGNPLVFCGCIGLIPRNRVHKEPKAGDRIVLAGGRTGRDGIHGATFSSSDLTDAHATEFAHAVQIGHAIEEKKLLDALLLARDHADGCLYSSVTDCGAGGLSSAVGEMGAKLGAVVDLEKVPLKYTGLRYDEIWISEAQERMVFAVPPESVDTFLNVFAAEEVEAGVIGAFTDDRILTVRYRGQTVGALDMRFLHEGRPKKTLTATWGTKPARTSRMAHAGVADAGTEHGYASVGHATGPARAEAHGSALKEAPGDRLLAALGEWNTASKEWVIRQYDHEVQGRSVLKPLVGPGVGPSDGAALRPLYDGHRGVAVGCGLNLQRGDVDPYGMAVAAVDEALRNVVCVGADPNRTAILDNFCWPRIDTEESLGALVRACRGASDAAIAYGLPFISGKDSLNNEFSMNAEEAKRCGLPERIAIPYTLLISALGIIEDLRRCVSMDLKQAGHCLVLASAPVIPSNDGVPDPSRAPKEAGGVVRFESATAMHHRVSELIRMGKVHAAHDVSDGGLAVAVAEMCIAGNLGATVEVRRGVYRDSIFAPLTTTYVLEMEEAEAARCELLLIGRTRAEPHLRIESDEGEPIELAVRELAQAWRTPLAQGGGG